MNNKESQLSNYSVIVVKIIKLKKRQGEFSISNIENDWSYQDINASHYKMLNERLLLFRTDTLFNSLMLENNIHDITDDIRNKAYDILAGPDISITRQPPAIAVVQYKKNRIYYKFYCGICRCEKKYWYSNDLR